jgi:signal transduction histidine kinase/CheY-like chemotaxis protein
MRHLRLPHTSIRQSLVLGSVGLIVVAFIVCAASIYLSMYRPLLGDLTASEMHRASEKVADSVQSIFVRVAAIAARHRDWGASGLMTLDNVHALNDLFSSLFKSDVGITSVAIAEDSGREVLIYSSSEPGWFNRLTDPDVWGKQALLMAWSERGELVSTEQREVDYDARRRPWFKAVMAQPSDAAIYWTPPYKFVSTQELGISAVARWTSIDGHRYAMTTDIKLLDLTRLTRQISVGKSGFAAILTDDGKLLAVPRDPRFTSAPAIESMLLKRVDELGISPLASGFAAWQAGGRPQRDIQKFDVDGTPWLGTFYPIHLAGQTFWIAALAASADFGALTGDTLALGVMLIVGSLLVASLGAIWLGTRFSGPIERLTAESARIGQMDLRRPIEVKSPVREIDALSQSLERMRLNLAQAQTDLEVKAVLERQLEQAQKMEAVGRLAGGIAHDFNNLLGTIHGFAGFLVQDLPKGTPQHGFAERIRMIGERGKDMVRQILAFARSTTVERAPRDLARIVTDTQALLRASLPSSVRLEVEIGSAANELIAEVNVGQVSQVLLNLCLNARDALPGETGRISIVLSRVDPGAADYAAFRAGAAVPRDGWICGGALDDARSYARITAADSGSCIDPAELKRIFDPFFTTKTRARGTGLGLSVVHGIILDYQGAYTVASRLGTGTTFTIYLPLAQHGVNPAAAAAPPVDVRGRERILVVDDDIDVTDMLTTGLDRLGYEVVALNDPAEALAVFGGDPSAWDVVISDEVMPSMKGLTLLSRFKAVRPSLRFILCTGFSDGDTEKAALEAGVDAYFLKPVSPEQLAACIRRLAAAA